MSQHEFKAHGWETYIFNTWKIFLSDQKTNRVKRPRCPLPGIEMDSLC
jgi:hypothetical protein